jgi:hypothetical protein
VDNELSYYQDITSGTGVDITVTPGNNAATEIIKQQKDFDAHDTGSSGTYTLAVAGMNGVTSGDTAAVILRLIDNWNSSPAANTAYIRLANLAPATPAGGLSLFNVSGGVATPISGLVNVEFAGPNTNAGVTNYIAVPIAGASQVFNLQVHQSTTGTLAPTASNISAITLFSGASYTFFLVGNLFPPVGAQPFDLKILPDFAPGGVTPIPH